MAATDERDGGRRQVLLANEEDSLVLGAKQRRPPQPSRRELSAQGREQRGRRGRAAGALAGGRGLESHPWLVHLGTRRRRQQPQRGLRHNDGGGADGAAGRERGDPCFRSKLAQRGRQRLREPVEGLLSRAPFCRGPGQGDQCKGAATQGSQLQRDRAFLIRALGGNAARTTGRLVGIERLYHLLPPPPLRGRSLAFALALFRPRPVPVPVALAAATVGPRLRALGSHVEAEEVTAEAPATAEAVVQSAIDQLTPAAGETGAPMARTQPQAGADQIDT
mmetsp:Transcript_148200/g.475976  ORF Transcript_148200/g.475976 Transcript_148200/m.475976 type:complete len:278 (+) Transcript_148200:4675-5508(+)